MSDLTYPENQDNENKISDPDSIDSDLEADIQPEESSDQLDNEEISKQELFEDDSLISVPDEEEFQEETEITSQDLNDSDNTPGAELGSKKTTGAWDFPTPNPGPEPDITKTMVVADSTPADDQNKKPANDQKKGQGKTKKPAKNRKPINWRLYALIAICLFVLSSGALGFVFLTSSPTTAAEASGTLGSTVEKDGIAYTLDEAYRTDESDFTYPYDGYEFLICEITVTNNTGASIQYDASDAMLIDNEGSSIEQDIWAVISDTQFTSEVIDAGDSFTGTIGFQIPTDSTDLTLELFYNGEPAAFFDLNAGILSFTPYADLIGSSTSTSDDEETSTSTDDETSTSTGDDLDEEEESTGTETETEDTDTTDSSTNSSTQGEVQTIDEGMKAPDNMVYTLKTIEFTSQSQSGQSATSGYEYLYCLINIENMSSSTLENYPAYWTISDSDGNEIPIAAGESEDYTGGSISSFESVEGYLVFEVPTTGSLTLNVYSSETHSENTLMASWSLSR